jgi:hypothetical protein
VLWIAFVSVVFCLPELNPVSTKTLNFAPVAVGIAFTYVMGFWILSALAPERRSCPIKQIAGVPRSLRYMRWLREC